MTYGASLEATWAASGALSLTGPPDGPPLLPPQPLLERIAALGQRVGVDAFAVMSERALISGSRRGGRISCGGTTRLLSCADGWVAVSLARPDDVTAVPAWLEVEPPGAADVWAVTEAVLAETEAAVARERAVLLGLPVAILAERRAIPEGPVSATRLGDASPLTSPPLVVDLSALWAGPLCGRILRHHGARVVKVESPRRPDGARRGPPKFFDLLNGGTRSVAVDLRQAGDVARLHALLRTADVVIEGTRPRALEQLGIDAQALVREGPRVWVSVTGHGRGMTERHRVAFGDDAAVAGGLTATDTSGEPCFFADAAADPLTGLAAAAATLDTLAGGGRWLLDIPLAGVAAELATSLGAAPWVAWRGPEPEVRVPPPPASRGPRLGEHTMSVFAEVGIE
jgi:hypothetical protein